MREGVDDAVDRLVRNRLALEATSGEHERTAFARHLLTEVSDQRALADARFARNLYEHRAPASAVLQRAGEQGHLLVAPEQLGGCPCGDEVRATRITVVEPGQDGLAGWPRRRLDAQELHA